VKGFFREYYGPANSDVTIVGDFQVAETKALVKKYFGGAEGNAGKRVLAPTGSVPKFDSIVHVTKTDDVKLPRIYLGTHLSSPFVAWRQAREVALEPSEPIPPLPVLDLDGETAPSGPFTLRVLPALSVLAERDDDSY
jgi:hypothetical protein